MVDIKHVGPYRIVLSEHVRHPLIIPRVAIVLLTAWGICLALFYITPTPGLTAIEHGACAIIQAAIVGTLMALGFVMITGIFTKGKLYEDEIFGYRVSINGSQKDKIDIDSKDPQSDQIAICNASKQLSSIAEEYVRRDALLNASLTAIAEKCK